MALALYRKYRPRTFAEVIGQEHVTEPLSQALRSGRLHHAYLFSGPRGCGKTSSARILARSLNCEQGPTPEPCGVCASCKSLANDGAGSIDVIEIDAASHGGVDDARELREKAFFAPANSRYKIYVIDEAHMVSSAGFNALLKLVEEPPEYVKFIFATTEPEKVLGTIRSRTHHYPFRLIPPAVLRPYLQQLTDAEGVHVEPTVFPLVVRAGGGSARDTLSVLDQLIAGAGPEGVSYARAVTLLGVTDGALIDEMCDAVAASDGAAAYQTIDRVAEAGHDPRRFASDLLERFRDLIVLQQVPDAVAKGLIDGPADQLEQMGAQATRLGPATLSRCADIVHNGLVEMRGTTAPRLLLELITARMLLPGADDSSGALLQRLERMERRLTLGADEVRPQPDAVAAGEPAPGGGGGGGGISAARAAAAAAGRRAPAPAPAPAPVTSTPSPTPASSAPVPGSAPVPEPANAAAGSSPAAAPANPAPASDPADSAPSSASANPEPSSAPVNSASAESMAAPAASHEGAVAPPATAPSRPEPAGIMPDAPEQPGAAPATGAAGQLSAAAIREIWPEIMVAVGRKSKKIAALAQGATVRDLEGQTVVLTFRFPAHAKMVAAEPALLSDALYEALGGRWQIRCDVAGPGGSGPVAQGQSGARQRSAPQRPTGDTDLGQAGGGATRQREAAPRPSSAGSSDDDGDGWPEPVRPGGLGSAAGGGAGASASTGTPGNDGDDWPEPVRPGSMPPNGASSMPPNGANGTSGSAPPHGAGTGPGGALPNGAGSGSAPSNGAGAGSVPSNGAGSGNVPSNGAGGAAGQQVAAGQAGFNSGAGEQSRGSGTSTADGMGSAPGLGTSPPADDRRPSDLNGSGEGQRPPHTDSRGGLPSGEQPAGGVRPRTPNDGPASPSRPASAGLAAARAAAAGAGRGGGAAAPGAGRGGGGATAPGAGRGGGATAPGNPGRSNPNGTSAWSDGSPTEEAPYDPEYDGPISSGAAAQSPAYEGFDPGDEPLDDVIDEKTARQSSEQQAVQLLRDALGAEKISES